MKLDSTPLRCLAAVVLVAGQGLVLWSGRDEWWGHGPMTGLWLVNAALWPSIVAAAIGALLVVLPRMTGLEPYHRTGVRQERELLGLAAMAWLGTILAVQVVCGVVGVVINDWIGGFGQLGGWNLVLAAVWPLFGFLLGLAGTRLLPRPLRVCGLAVFPVIMFTLVAGGGQFEPGPVASLSPTNVLVLPHAAEPWWVGMVRVATVGGVMVVCASTLFQQWLRWPGIALTVGALLAAFWTMPAAAVPIAGAEDPHCREVEGTRVCWSAWGRIGSDRFVSSLRPVLERTPPALRPNLVTGSAEPLVEGKGHMWIGYPNALSRVTVRPDPAAVRRTYARELVTGSCQASPVAPLFVVRTARAVGITPDEPVGPGEFTQGELVSLLVGDDRTLWAKLDQASDAQVFALIADLGRDPGWCSADAATWITRLS